MILKPKKLTKMKALSNWTFGIYGKTNCLHFCINGGRKSHHMNVEASHKTMRHEYRTSAWCLRSKPSYGNDFKSLLSCSTYRFRYAKKPPHMHWTGSISRRLESTPGHSSASIYHINDATFLHLQSTVLSPSINSYCLWLWPGCELNTQPSGFSILHYIIYT